jgi:hypothetical protein
MAKKSSKKSEGIKAKIDALDPQQQLDPQAAQAASKTEVEKTGVTPEDSTTVAHLAGGKIIRGKDHGKSPAQQSKEARGGGDGGLKTDRKAGKGKTFYVGPLTCHSTHAETGEPISVKMDIGDPMLEEGAWRAFQAHHPMAVREDFEIDAENTTDPNLRSHKEIPQT